MFHSEIQCVQHVEKTTKWTKSNGRGSTYISIFPSKPKIENVLIKHVPQQLLGPGCYLDSLLKNIPFVFWIFSSKSFKLKTQKAYVLRFTTRTTTSLLLHNYLLYYLLSPLRLWIYVRRLSRWPQRLFISLKFVTQLCYILRFCSFASFAARCFCSLGADVAMVPLPDASTFVWKLQWQVQNGTCPSHPSSLCPQAFWLEIWSICQEPWPNVCT